MDIESCGQVDAGWRGDEDIFISPKNGHVQQEGNAGKSGQ